MKPETLHAVRREAWRFGREFRDALLHEYESAYGCTAPPPALIVDELITDFLGARLRFDPLPVDRYAETYWDGDNAVVVINSLTADIPGVRDASGVQNVAKLHETIHVGRDMDVLRVGDQGAFEGFLPAPKIRCYRDTKHQHREGTFLREFWAEEAGRAAAVSYRALSRSAAFLTFSSSTELSNSAAWSLLYEAASDIGVNASALVKQLRYEGYLSLEQQGSRSIIERQPALFGLMRAAA